MAWIEYHEQLRDHWKVKRLSDELRIPYTQALGLLSCLWTWAVSNARNGDLTRFTVSEIASAARWESKPEVFTAAILKTGWIDQDQRLHDWEDYGVRLLENLKRRVKRYRNVTVTHGTGKERRGKDKVVVKEGVVKGEQPHQTLINRFLELKGTPRTTLATRQVTGQYQRHSRAALALIAEAGGLDHALIALECCAAYFDRKRLSWTLETVAKHLPDLSRYSDELAGANHGLTPVQLDSFRQLAKWVATKTDDRRRGEGAGSSHQGVSVGSP